MIGNYFLEFEDIEINMMEVTLVGQKEIDLTDGEIEITVKDITETMHVEDLPDISFENITEYTDLWDADMV